LTFPTFKPNGASAEDSGSGQEEGKIAINDRRDPAEKFSAPVSDRAQRIAGVISLKGDELKRPIGSARTATKQAATTNVTQAKRQDAVGGRVSIGLKTCPPRKSSTARWPENAEEKKFERFHAGER